MSKTRQTRKVNFLRILHGVIDKETTIDFNGVCYSRRKQDNFEKKLNCDVDVFIGKNKKCGCISCIKKVYHIEVRYYIRLCNHDGNPGQGAEYIQSLEVGGGNHGKRRSKKRKRRKIESSTPSRIHGTLPSHGPVDGGNRMDTYFSLSSNDGMYRFSEGNRNVCRGVSVGGKMSTRSSNPIKVEDYFVLDDYKGDPNHRACSEATYVISCFVPPGDAPGPVRVSLHLFKTLSLENGYRYENREILTEPSLEGMDSNHDESGDRYLFMDDLMSDIQKDGYIGDGLGSSFLDHDHLDEFGGNVLMYAIAQDKNNLDLVKDIILQKNDLLFQTDLFGISCFDVARHFGKGEILEYIEPSITSLNTSVFPNDPFFEIQICILNGFLEVPEDVEIALIDENNFSEKATVLDCTIDDKKRLKVRSRIPEDTQINGRISVGVSLDGIDFASVDVFRYYRLGQVRPVRGILHRIDKGFIPGMSSMKRVVPSEGRVSGGNFANILFSVNEERYYLHFREEKKLECRVWFGKNECLVGGIELATGLSPFGEYITKKGTVEEKKDFFLSQFVVNVRIPRSFVEGSVDVKFRICGEDLVIRKGFTYKCEDQEKENLEIEKLRRLLTVDQEKFLRTLNIIRCLRRSTIMGSVGSIALYDTLNVNCQIEGFEDEFVLKFFEKHYATTFLEQEKSTEEMFDFPSHPNVRKILFSSDIHLNLLDFDENWKMYKRDFDTSRMILMKNYKKDLGQYIKERKDHKKKKFTDAEVFYYLFQLIEGASHLHNHRIVHRDLHPENIFIEISEGIPRLLIGDFGCALNLLNNKTGFQVQKGEVNFYSFFPGTSNHSSHKPYLAPEIVDFEDKDVEFINFEKNDLFSVGMIGYSLMNEKNLDYPTPFGFDFNGKPRSSRKQRDYVELQGCSSEFADLVKSLLLVDPGKRIGFQEALERVTDLLDTFEKRELERVVLDESVESKPQLKKTILSREEKEKLENEETEGEDDGEGTVEFLVTPLSIAASRGDVEKVKRLVEEKNVSIEERDILGNSPEELSQLWEKLEGKKFGIKEYLDSHRQKVAMEIQRKRIERSTGGTSKDKRIETVKIDDEDVVAGKKKCLVSFTFIPPYFVLENFGRKMETKFIVRGKVSGGKEMEMVINPVSFSHLQPEDFLEVAFYNPELLSPGKVKTYCRIKVVVNENEVPFTVPGYLGSYSVQEQD